MTLTKEEQLEAIERYYQSQVAGAPSDEQELAVAEALLEAAERGAVVLDDGSTMVLRDMGVPSDADFLVDEGALRRQELRRTLPILGALVVAMIAVFLLYGGSGTPSEEATPTIIAAAQVALSTATLTPTITPTPSPTSTGTPTSTPTATLTPTPLAPEEVEVKIEPVKLDPSAVIPVSIEIAGRYFPVLPTGLREDNWAYATDPDQASWLAGSYVNVVLGLPYTETNADLLAGTLALSDTVTVRNSVAAVNHYRVVDRHTASIYEIEAFSQRQAGLTLVLLGGNEEDPDRRLIILATLAETEREEVIDTQGE